MIRLLVGLIIVSVAIASAADLVGLQASSSSNSFPIDINNFYTPIAAHEDTLVTFGWNSSDATVWLVFRKQNGQYIKVSEVPDGDTYALSAFNNGKWMGGCTISGKMTLFQLDANDKPVNFTRFDMPHPPFAGLLSDSTIVLFNFSTESWESMLFNANSGNWSKGPSIAVGESFNFFTYPSATYWIEDNHIIFLNNSWWTFIYTRQQDGSWKETDGFAFDISILSESFGQANVYFNGVDTVVFAFQSLYSNTSTTTGFLMFYTKVGNTWQPQAITGEQLGFVGNSGLGWFSFAAVNQNSLLFGAPNEGIALRKRGGPSTTDIPTGKVLLVQRQNATSWTATAVVSSPEIGFFGTSAAVTKDDIVITFLTSSNTYDVEFYTLPRCIAEPVDVTCHDQQASSCDTNTIDTSTAYTINQCFNLNTTASVQASQVTQSSVSITFEFHRALSPPVTCSATLTCPNAPTLSPAVITPVAKTISSASTIEVIFGVFGAALFCLVC